MKDYLEKFNLKNTKVLWQYMVGFALGFFPPHQEESVPMIKTIFKKSNKSMKYFSVNIISILI